MTPPSPAQRDARVIVEHPTMGRTYCTVIGPHDQPVGGEPAMALAADGYINPWHVPFSMVHPATCARDMHAGDLLNLDMLKEVIEVEFLGSLWTHGDSGMMTPYVCEAVFGDGLHLLTISTINQRPNYHVVRVDSTWREASIGWHDWRDDMIGDHIDDVLTAIEDECGRARCGYSGNSLRWPRDERIANCECEECDDDGISEWPEIDADGGCSWGHIRWPWLMKELGITAQLERLRP